MKESNDYYSSICKNCGADCDDVFCSYACRVEWEEGYGDYLYECYKDSLYPDSIE